MQGVHTPVLLQEILALLNPKPGEQFIDATINGGGHARALAERVGPTGKIVGIDWDCDLIEELRIKNIELRRENIKLICDNYAHLRSIVAKHHLVPSHGILLDLGFSSHHIEDSKRGFSFLRNEPLDMRYNTKDNALTAEKIINTWSGESIEILIRDYGEERYARSITRGILEVRRIQKITTTDKLAALVSKSIPRRSLKHSMHPATRTFQALRIAVNRELENLKRVLPDLADILCPHGRVAIISFHSLEDRIVKNFFKEAAHKKHMRIITKKPLIATRSEIADNPRARSAKLRVAEKL